MPIKKSTTKKAASKKATAKKVVQKKGAAKGAAKKGTAKRDLVYADNNSSFWVTDGRVLNSLVALADALSEMEKEVYSYHVAKDRNDFATWVSDVLCDAACAKDLHQAKSPRSARTVVVRHLKLYAV